MSRDLTAVQAAILGSLAKDPESVDVEGFADLALRLAEAVGVLQSVAVEGLVEQQVQRARVARQQRSADRAVEPPLPPGPARQALGIYKRYETPFALLVLDVDGLKRVNDSKGHQAGDRALVQVATAMRRTLRTTDTAARIGGDEFCVLATEPDRRGRRAARPAHRRRRRRRDRRRLADRGLDRRGLLPRARRRHRRPARRWPTGDVPRQGRRAQGRARRPREPRADQESRRPSNPARRAE